jgi:hypothetical protein
MRKFLFAIGLCMLSSLHAYSAERSIVPSTGAKVILIACNTNAARQCQQGANACYSRCGNGTGDLYKRCRDHCLSEYDSCKYVAGCR